MNIQQLTKQLEEQINIKVEELVNFLREYEILQKRFEDIENKMNGIHKELVPVEYMVLHHNPSLKSLFDNLKNKRKK